MKLKFVIDKNYDSWMIYEILSSKSGIIDVKYQADCMGLDIKTAKKISKAKKFEDIASLISDISDERYSKIEKYMKLALEGYQSSWNEIDDDFFGRLEEITKFQIQHKAFECILSDFHIGISNWGGNKIVRSWKESPFIQRRITAHEIIISHFFSYIYTNHPEITDKHLIWELAEIFAFIITGTDKIMTEFWPWDKSGAYTDHNYPDLIRKQKKLTKIYTDDGFDAFIKAGWALI